MEKVYQIFVSSTFSDLHEERKLVSNMLSKAGHLVAGMELFPATDQQQLEYIYRVIDRSDYYVVIVGGRYGSLSDDGISFTEKEFEYAHAKGIPILAFIHGAPDTIEVGKTDRDNTKLERLNHFKRRLSTDRVIDYWTDPLQLAANVVIAVGNAINLRPATGWVRGDQAIDPKLVQEMEKLRVENQRLEQLVAKTRLDEVQFPENLAGPADSVEIFVKTRRPGTPELPQDRIATIEIGSLFLLLYDSILTEPSEARLQRLMGKAAAALDQKNQFPKDVETSVPTGEVKKLRFHLEALGLIQAVGRVEQFEDTGTDYIAWSITEKGRRFAALSQGIQKPIRKRES